MPRWSQEKRSNPVCAGCGFEHLREILGPREILGARPPLPRTLAERAHSGFHVMPTPPVYRGPMRLHHLRIEHFRGIANLDWAVAGDLLCLVGPGDAGKTTLLDAIEWVLSPRWSLPVSDADFWDLDTDTPIVIEATVGEVPDDLMMQQLFGHYLRFRCPVDGALYDEPAHDDDEPVITVRLSVGEYLEPEWEVVCGDHREPRRISHRHRARLGMTRLGQSHERQFRWGRGSSLDALTDAMEGPNQALVRAHRMAREAVTADDLGDLDDAIDQVRAALPIYGARVDPDQLAARLDPMSLGAGASALTLALDELPLAAFGQGTGRLAALAIQSRSVPEGALLLIDEIETGLEPYRLRHLMRHLRNSLSEAANGTLSRPTQVLFTTHSSVAVVELVAPELHVVRTEGGATSIRQGTEPLQALFRTQPEALLSPAVIIGEGKTEVGLALGIEDFRANALGQPPLAHRGVAVAVGGGRTKAPPVAVGLSGLGYRACLLCDSDEPIEPGVDELTAAGVQVVQWSGGVHTEGRLAADLPLPALERVLQVATARVTPGQIRGDVAALAHVTAADMPEQVTDWVDQVDEADLRLAIGTALAKGSWIKDIPLGIEVGKIVAQVLDDIEGTDLHAKIGQLDLWCDGA